MMPVYLVDQFIHWVGFL